MLQLPSTIFGKLQEELSNQHLTFHFQEFILSFDSTDYFNMNQLLIEESNDDYIVLGSLFMRKHLLYFSEEFLGVHTIL